MFVWKAYLHRERKSDLPSTSLNSKCPQQLGRARLGPGTKTSALVSHVGVAAQELGPSSTGFPLSLAGVLNEKWNSQDFNMMLALQATT